MPGARRLTVVLFATAWIVSACVSVTPPAQTGSPVALPTDSGALPTQETVSSEPPPVEPTFGPTATPPPAVPPSLSPDPGASPSPTRRPSPTRTPRPTEAPTPSPIETPQVVDLRAVSYFVRTGQSGDRNYIFVDVVVRNNGNVRSGPYDVVISCRGSSSSMNLDALGRGRSVDLTFSFPADGPPGNEYVGVGWVYVNTADESHNFAMDVVTGDPVTGDPQLCVN